MFSGVSFLNCGFLERALCVWEVVCAELLKVWHASVLAAAGQGSGQLQCSSARACLLHGPGREGWTLCWVVQQLSLHIIPGPRLAGEQHIV